MIYINTMDLENIEKNGKSTSKLAQKMLQA